MHTPLIPDQAIRLTACDPTQSFTVRAPAGSGKTELLIARIMRLLEVVDNPHTILAITFTRKAKEEMQERLCTRLFVDNPDHPLHARAASLGWAWDKHIAPCTIMTIDGWIQSFIQSPYTLHPMHHWLYREALHQWLSYKRYPEELHTVLEHFDNVHTFSEWVQHALSCRDIWINDILDPTSFSEVMIQRSNERLEEWQSELSHLLGPDREALEHIITTLPQHPHVPNSFPRIGDHALWYTMACWLYTADGSARKRLTLHQGFPSGQYIQEKQQLLAIISTWDDRIHTLWSYMQGAHCPQNPTLLDALRTILRDILASLHMVFERYKACDFIHYMLEALSTIEEHRGQLSIEHLLIDEAQDTSHTQIALIEKLTRTMHNPRNTIFMVGDPMQSIYRFRHADVRAFMHVIEHGFPHHPFTHLTLSANFRQHQHLVAMTNHIFSPLFPSSAQLEEGAIPFTPSKAMRQEPGSCHTLLWDNNAAHTPEDCDNIELHERVQTLEPSETVGLLVRARSRMSPFLTYSALHYPLHTVDILDASQSPFLKDALELLILCMHPYDTQSYHYVLRSRWVGISLNDLTLLGEKATFAEALILCPTLTDSTTQHNLHYMLRSYRNLYTTTYALSDLYLGWLRELGVLAVLSSDEHKTLSIILEHIATWLPSFKIFSRSYIETLFTHQRITQHPKQSAVTAMSIHKAKGLEFDHVYIPLIDKPIRPQAIHKIIITTTMTQHGHQCIFWHKPTTESHTPWIVQLIKKQEYYENIRLLYVACTRAKKTLTLTASTDKNWAKFMPSWHTKTCTITPQDHTSSTQALRIIHPSSPESIPHTAHPLIPDKEQHFGILLHAALYRVWQIPPQTYHTATHKEMYTWFTTYGLLHAMPRHIIRSTWAFFKKILTYPTVLNTLKRRADFCAAEYTIYYHNSHCIIDRCYIEDGTLYIIDYKTSSQETPHKQSYIEQLSLYSTILQTYYPHTPIKKGILWLQNGTIEWV